MAQYRYNNHFQGLRLRPQSNRWNLVRITGLHAVVSAESPFFDRQFDPRESFWSFSFSFTLKCK